MPANIGLQISSELSKILPIRSVVDTVGSQILKLARDLRLSGSDIVVEEDLAEVFGRGQINPELEAKFKDVVKVHNFIPISHGCEIILDSGPGPTMLRAFRDKRYFAMVIQLSLLAWMHGREDFATMLSQAMTERVDMGVPEATAGPGNSGIILTLTACSSQSSAFSWGYYIKEVDNRFRTSITNYYFHSDHLKLTRHVLLAAMDYLYLVQRFPEDRKVTVSNAIGSITLIIWAHHVLGLTVAVVEPASDAKVIFGDHESPHMIITWPETRKREEEYLYWPSCSDDVGPEIRLLDSKMSVILESTEEVEKRTEIIADERHPLTNYGVTYLRRLFNTVAIISDNDPIYEESAKWATALAIHRDRRLDRKFESEYTSTDFDANEGLCPAASVEIWRILSSARIIFADISLQASHIDSYVKFLSETALDKDHLPSTFSAFLKRVPDSQPFSPAEKHLDNIKHLASIVLIFAHVSEIESCADLPIVFHNPADRLLGNLMEKGPKERFELENQAIFHAVANLLIGHGYSPERKTDFYLFLCSDFGWSVFLDTVGDKDPGVVRPELVHVKRGTPTNSKTKERRLRIRDGRGYNSLHMPETFQLLRGLEYLPRLAARVHPTKGRQEYWTSRTEHFEATIYLSVEASFEWRQHSDVPSWQQVIKYGNMQKILWSTHSSPYCDHPRLSEPAPTKLGPDAVVLMGFDSLGENIAHNETQEVYPERIIIYLSRGDARIRWLAIENAVSGREHPVCREVMLRTAGCCDACALEHTASLPGRWTLIL